MKKYWRIFQISWQAGLVYRVNVLLWRLRVILSTITSLTLWSVLFVNNPTQLGYTANEMISYLFIVSILQSLIHSSTLHSLGWTVYSGELSKYLVKPIAWPIPLILDDLADKAKNVGFAVVEFAILAVFFHPTWPTQSIGSVVLGLMASLLGAALLMEIQFLFGALGFRTPDMWAPRYLLYILIEFTSGKLFPLDILPRAIQDILFLTPLPYFSFVQAQIWLGKMNLAQSLWQTTILLAWVAALGALNYKIWTNSFRTYSASGH